MSPDIIEYALSHVMPRKLQLRLKEFHTHKVKCETAEETLVSNAGLGRLVSVKSLDYQEHVTEYGVHWNFFLTVAAVSALTALVPISKGHSLAAGNSHSLVAGACLHCL